MIRTENAWSRALVLLEIKRTEALIADLRRMLLDQYPTEQDRAAAVKIYDAEHCHRMEPCLVGVARSPAARRVPSLPAELGIKVTDLRIGDFGRGWVRNRYGLYRLGWEQ